MSGPANFMGRLTAALAGRRLPPHRIVMPATMDDGPSGADEVIIGRFDGLFMYRFTLAAAYNFVRVTKLPRLPRSTFLERRWPYSSAPLDRMAARHLNRRDPRLKQRADVLVYQSTLSEQEHRIIGGPDPIGTPSVRIANGAPLDVFRPLPTTGLLKSAPRLGITAQFRLGKRLREAVGIVNALRRAHPQATLHVIGPLDRLVAESLQDLDCSACVLHGYVPSETLPEFYAGLDIGLSPALLDPCPNSVIEMMACGLPVITTQASGAAELVPGDALIVPETQAIGFTELHNSWRIPAVETADWCRAIERVLEQRAHWREVCLAHARENFDIDVVAGRYAAVIEAAWERRERGRGR